MSTILPVSQIEYPESDGLPMGETDVHRLLMTYIFQVLTWRYRHERVYVGSNMFVYYEQGNPTLNFAPDDFVVLDCDPHVRRVFKTWEEGRTPNTAFEIASARTWSDDLNVKPTTMAKAGVKELFLIDPTGEYLKPSLIGFQLDADGSHSTIKSSVDGALRSQQLGITLRLEDGELLIHDTFTGQRLLTEAEAEHARAEAESARAEAASARAETASARAEAETARAEAETARAEAETARAEAERLAREIAEARVAELTEQLRQLKGDS